MHTEKRTLKIYIYNGFRERNCRIVVFCLFAYLYFLRGESLNLSIRKKTDFVLEKIKQWKKTWTPCDPIK